MQLSMRKNKSYRTLGETAGNSRGLQNPSKFHGTGTCPAGSDYMYEGIPGENLFFSASSASKWFRCNTSQDGEKVSDR